MTAVGYDHSLAKGATVYIAYAKVDNDDNASFSATNWGHGKDVGVGAAGEDPSSISVGFIYDF
jgi:predicted porin